MRMRKTARTALGLVAAVTALSAVTAPSAFAATASAVPSVHLKLFAAAPSGLKNPDDITKLGDLLFVAYQNGAQSDGSPAGVLSDVLAFDLKTGTVKHHYQFPGKVDGLTADSRHHRVLVTVNEDLNSSLYTITPSEDENAPIKHYTYSPSPAQTGSDGVNGGTDALSISSNGTIYVAHSNPDGSLPGANNTAAVYTVKLDDSTAKLTPVFGINDTAAVINPAAGAPKSAPLGLTDPDSNRWVPGRDGGTLIQDAQADSKLVYVSDLDAKKPTVRQLNLTNAETLQGRGHPAARRHPAGLRLGHALRGGPGQRHHLPGRPVGREARHDVRLAAEAQGRRPAERPGARRGRPEDRRGHPPVGRREPRQPEGPALRRRLAPRPGLRQHDAPHARGRGGHRRVITR